MTLLSRRSSNIVVQHHHCHILFSFFLLSTHRHSFMYSIPRVFYCRQLTHNITSFDILRITVRSILISSILAQQAFFSIKNIIPALLVNRQRVSLLGLTLLPWSTVCLIRLTVSPRKSLHTTLRIRPIRQQEVHRLSIPRVVSHSSFLCINDKVL